MTVEDVQVIVYHGEHVLFDERTLIQIAGRVGRKPDFPTGKVYILKIFLLLIWKKEFRYANIVFKNSMLFKLALISIITL